MRPLSLLVGLPLLLTACGETPTTPADVPAPQFAVAVRPPATALVAHWTLDGNAQDAGPSGLDGTILGAVTPTADPDGVAGGAMAFSGGAHIRVPHSPLLNFADFTISFWVKPLALQFGNIITKGRDGLNGYEFRYLASGDLSLDLVNGNRWAGDPIVGYVKAPVPVGSWHQVTGVVNNATLKITLYVDGALAAEANLLKPYATNTTYPLVFGRHYTAPDGSEGFVYPFNGALDDVRMYSMALSAAEIRALQPRPAVIAPLGTAELLEGETLALAGSFTDDGMIHQWSAAVDYGDGDGTEPLALVGNTFTLSHLYGTAGTYTVTVTVGDDWGNVSQGTAAVEVLAPSAAAGALEEEIAALVTSGAVAAEAQSALEASLGEAMDSYAKGNLVAGNNQMGAFINKVEAGLKSGKITAAAGAWLIAQAQRIILSGQGQTKDVGKGEGKG